jgi:hypothetical protein
MTHRNGQSDTSTAHNLTNRIHPPNGYRVGGATYVYQLTNQIRPHAKPGTQRKLDSSSFHWPNRIINRAQTSLRKQSQEVYSKKKIDLLIRLLQYFEFDRPSLPLLSLSEVRSRQKISAMRTYLLLVACVLASCLIPVPAADNGDKEDVGTVIGIDLGTTYSW